MGLQESAQKTYLRVSYGKICKTATADTPKAVSRINSKNETVWELVWESLTGTLDDIRFRDDPNYGKSWNLDVKDGDELYVLQVNEDSRYGSDLLKKVPKLFKGRQYNFKPYEYEKNGKRKVGIWITDNVTGEKIESHFQQFTQKQDGSWEVKNLHGFPEFDGNAKDKDDLKIYFLKVTKFLREQAQKHLREGFGSEPEQVPPPAHSPEDDLPF